MKLRTPICVVTRAPKASPPGDRHRGSALIIVLWVTATLSILLGTVTLSVYSLNQATVYQKEAMEADAWSQGALAVMQAELYAQRTARTERIRGLQLGLWAIRPPVTAAETGRAAGLWVPADVTGFDVAWAAVKLPTGASLPGADGTWITAEVLAEDAKLPLNKLTDLGHWDAVPNVGHTELAAAICEERSAAPFTCMEELLQRVERLTPERYRGNAEAKALPELLTTFSLGSVYINGAGEDVLAAIPELGRDIAHSITLRLQNPANYFATLADVDTVDGLRGNGTLRNRIKAWLRVMPVYYRIRVTVCLNGTVARREAVVYLSESGMEMGVAWNPGG